MTGFNERMLKRTQEAAAIAELQAQQDKQLSECKAVTHALKVIMQDHHQLIQGLRRDLEHWSHLNTAKE